MENLVVCWGECYGTDLGFCPTPAVAFKAFEPPFVYKLRCLLHPLEPSVFVLSIQSVRLIGFPDNKDTSGGSSLRSKRTTRI